MIVESFLPRKEHERSIIPFNVRALNSRNKSKLVNLIRERSLVVLWGKVNVMEQKKIYIIYIYIHIQSHI